MTALEQVIEELVAEGRRGRHLYSAEQNAALDDEARRFYRKVLERYAAALGVDPFTSPNPRHPMFRNHRCWKCNDGERPCVQSRPGLCEYPHARND